MVNQIEAITVYHALKEQITMQLHVRLDWEMRVQLQRHMHIRLGEQLGMRLLMQLVDELNDE
jgi:hypothetical protein